jgi:ATP-binding cassette subfamily B protein
VKDADLILVLERGRLAETGTHEELLKGNGLYRRLWDIQTALSSETDGDLSSSQGKIEDGSGFQDRQFARSQE